MSDLAALVVIFVLVTVAGLMVMAETAISRLGRARAHVLGQEKRKGSERLVQVVENPASHLNVLLLLRLGAYVGATVLAVDVALRHFERGGASVLVAVALTIVIFIFAEVVPKTFALQHTERLALVTAWPVYLLGTVLKPVGQALILLSNAVMVVLPGRGMPHGPFVTEDELRHLVNVAEEEEEIEEEERELIHSVFEFGDTVVREVMVPRPDMVVIKADAGLDQALETITDAGYSRIPIYEGDTDNIVGVLYAKDLLKHSHAGKGAVKASSLGRAPLFVPEQKKVADLLREMQEQRIHMAIVVDEYGGTAGLVTIEDLVEEIVGEIVDEYDREEPLVEPIDEETIRVDAKMAIDEVNELLDADLPHEEWDTVGGLVFGLTGRVPAAGETVRYDSLEFLTERVTGRRVQKVVITKFREGAEETVEQAQ
jgi:CBS domain containing-hemolysin-like protein